MTDTTNFPDPSDGTLTDQDLADLETLSEEPPVQHTLLQVWREILSNIEQSAAERVTPARANQLVSNWPKLSFQDIPVYHVRYHNLLLELREILLTEIAKDPDALKHFGADDVIENRGHYVELLFAWQERVLEWEHNWEPLAHDSHIDLAAIADATAFFVGPQGLVEHLSQVGFQYTDEDREELAARLTEAKAAL